MRKQRQYFQENPKIRMVPKVKVKKRSRERDTATKTRKVVSLSYQRATLVMKNQRNRKTVSKTQLKRNKRKESKRNKVSSVPLQKYWMTGRRSAKLA